MDRPGPQGGHIRPRRQYVRAPGTTHSRPLQGLPGPAPLYLALSSSKGAGWVVPGIALPYTHPYTRPRTRIPVPAPSSTHHDEHELSYGDTRFEVTVGEPRGSRTHPVFALFGTVWHCLALVGTLHLVMRLFY